MSLELDCANVAIALLQGQAALSGFQIRNRFDDDDADINRIVVKENPPEIAVPGISPGEPAEVSYVHLDVELRAVSSTDANVDAYIAAIDRAMKKLKITTISQANPTAITTETPHGFATGDSITIINSSSTPTVNGARTITVTSATTFTVPVNVTVAGSGGIAAPTAAVTAATAAFPNGADYDPTDDGEKDQTDNRRTRSKRVRFMVVH